jgi:RNA 2',3'-cyclic 3'-phosphodiesterase
MPAAARVAVMAQKLCGEANLTAKPFAPKRFHISLHHLGDYVGVPNDVVAKAFAAASSLSESGFDVRFDRAGSFMGGRRKLPLVLRGGNSVIPMIAFQHALGEAMRRCGLSRWVASHYTPHVTMLYDQRYVEAREVEPIEWSVREFVLIHSVLGKTRHFHLARWTLRD